MDSERRGVSKTSTTAGTAAVDGLAGRRMEPARTYMQAAACHAWQHLPAMKHARTRSAAGNAHVRPRGGMPRGVRLWCVLHLHSLPKHGNTLLAALHWAASGVTLNGHLAEVERVKVWAVARHDHGAAGHVDAHRQRA